MHFIDNFSDKSQPSATAQPCAIIFLGGELNCEALLGEITSNANLIVCADSGAEHARKLVLTPNAIVGDLDSVTADTLSYFENMNSQIVRIPDQESNDFEKALQYLLQQFERRSETEKSISSRSVFVFGMTGGRTDHTLANFSVMLRYSDNFDNIIAYEPRARHRFLTAKNNNCLIECETGTTFSLTPFGEAKGVVTKNLKYPLSSETLALGIREGVSNVSSGSPVSISIDGGALLVTVLYRD